MRRNSFIITSVLLISAIFISSCRTVPISVRKQLNFLPESMLVEMNHTINGEYLDSNKLASNQVLTAMVKRVGERIAASVVKYLRDNGLESRIKDFNWEFNLVEDETPNAWCMPGGKIIRLLEYGCHSNLISYSLKNRTFYD